MRSEKHIVNPGYRMQVLEVVGEPGQHPRHTVVRLHLQLPKRSKAERSDDYLVCVGGGGGFS